MRLRICSWAEYQHYKERNPPWIKLHTSLLTSRLWVSLDDASRVLAIASMLIASRDNGEFDADPDYFRRVAYLNGEPDWRPLIEKGFCETVDKTLAHASNLLADASNMHTNARPEKRREEEIRVEESKAPHTPQGGHGGAEPDSPNESPANPPSTIAEFRTETPRHSQNGSAVASAQHQEAKTPYKPTESGTDTPSSIMEAWNALADMPGVRLERAVAFTAKRKASARERLRDAYFRENWRAALDKIRADKFYQGCGDRGWIAGIDYFLRPDTVAKIMEKSKGVMGPPDGWFAGEFEGFEDGVEAMRRKRAQHAAA